MKNTGKRFEDNFRESVGGEIFFYRFRDGTSSWGRNGATRFQQTNMCDCEMFDGERLFLLELKSVIGKSLPFGNIKDHQLNELVEASCHKNIVAGFIIEFSSVDRCFFIGAKDMAYYMNNSGRKSVPLSYLESKGLEIEVKKLRVNVRLDIEKFIKEVK